MGGVLRRELSGLESIWRPQQVHVHVKQKQPREDWVFALLGFRSDELYLVEQYLRVCWCGHFGRCGLPLQFLICVSLVSNVVRPISPLHLEANKPPGAAIFDCVALAALVSFRRSNAGEGKV